MALKRKGKYVPGGFVLNVKRSRTGLGLYAGEDIPKGSCIIEYKGRRVSDKEKFTSRSLYLYEINDKITIDGGVRTNTARYINHSCRPNAESVTPKDRIFIMALKNIKQGEEITYDYDTEYFEEHIKPKGCLCAKCSPIK